MINPRLTQERIKNCLTVYILHNLFMDFDEELVDKKGGSSAGTCVGGLGSILILRNTKRWQGAHLGMGKRPG